MYKLAVAAAGLILSLPSLAAPPPQAIQPGAAGQRSRQLQHYYQQRQQHPQPNKTSNPVIAPGKHANENANKTPGPVFKLEKVTFSPSHFLSRETLTAIVQPYIGHTIHISDLRAIVARINKHYTMRHIYTARAILPPQRIKNGTVQIELVEGKLGSLKIEHNNHTRSSFIRSRITQQKGTVVDGKQLKSDLVFFNRTSDIQLRALMRPGQSRGLTQILLLAQEPARYVIAPFVDDAGAHSTGRYRAGISLRWTNPLGIDDRFDGYFADSRGERSGFASYSLPVDRANGRVGVSYSHNAIDIVHGPFEQLDITGNSTTESLDFTQPLIADSQWLVTWASSLSHTRAKTKIEDVRVADSSTDQLATGITVTSTVGHHQWSTTQTINGIHSDQPLDNKHGFFIYNGVVSYLQAFGKSPYSLSLRLVGQYSPADQLPSQNLFQIGGVNSVRGYEQGVVAGNSGFFGQVELHRNIMPSLDVFAFVDGGAVYQAFPSNKYIASIGPGLAFHYPNWLSGSLSIGVPLEKVTPNQDSFRINFRITARWTP